MSCDAISSTVYQTYSQNSDDALLTSSNVSIHVNSSHYVIICDSSMEGKKTFVLTETFFKVIEAVLDMRRILVDFCVCSERLSGKVGQSFSHDSIHRVRSA